MKRSLLAVLAISALALVACEPQGTVEEIPAADETQDMTTDTAMPMQPDTTMGMMDTTMMDTTAM